MIIRRFLTIKLIKGNRNLEFWNIPSYEILLFIKSEHGQVPLCKTVINRGWQGLPIFTELTRENDVTQNLTNQNEKKCFRAPRKQWGQAVPSTRFETFQHCHLFILIIDIIISSSSYHQYDIYDIIYMHHDRHHYHPGYSNKINFHPRPKRRDLINLIIN